MTTFINRKEQVLDIELTSYGKYLSSVGKFKPKYYAFYDNDIIYDGTYAGIAESQNDITERIKTTPRTKVQTRFSSLSSNFESGPDGANLSLSFNNIKPSSNTFFKPLGTSDTLKDNAPAWLLRNMPGSVGFSGSAAYNDAMSIPILSSSIDTVYSKKILKTPSPEGGEDIEHEIHELVKDEFILLDIQEINSRFKAKGNYEIEVFMEPPNNEDPKKLFFIAGDGEFSEDLRTQIMPSELIRRISGTDEEIGESFPTLDNNYVDYYLKIEVDNEIKDVNFVKTMAGYYNNVSTGSPTDPCED
tara:strand:- start:46 stop:951 length:906 start_codon:yes stop_codon:yes gene_type:complete